jgi:hypothetical protein
MRSSRPLRQQRDNHLRGDLVPLGDADLHRLRNR